MLSVREKMFLSKVQFLFPEVSVDTSGISRIEKIYAFLYCELNSISNPINKKPGQREKKAGKLVDIILRYYEINYN